MNLNKKWVILIGVAVIAGPFVFFGLSRSTQAQHFTARVERGDIHDVVDATGTINAVILVQVGSQVSGTIAKLNVDFNSRVHKGDIVALIDPALFQGALLQASADLDNAKANLVAAKANQDKATATAQQTKADYDRTAELTTEKITSQQQLDLAKANYDSANAGVGAAVANVTQAQAQVSQKAASLQAPTIFTIAQDLTKMLVYTKTDESDVGNIRPGKAVTFKVDAFPKDTFHGVVSQVRMNPTTVQSVVTYDTIIEFANPEMKLFPGMTAYVTIPVDTVQNVLKVPNTALRYKPPMAPEEILAVYKQYGIDGNEKLQAADDPAAPGHGPQTSAENQNAPRAPRAENAVVWRLHGDNTMEPVKISLGITDHAYTQVASVIKGELKEGDALIIRSVMPKSQAPGTLRR